MTAPAVRAQPKITYSAIGGNLDEIHQRFEETLERVVAGFGQTHQSIIDGKPAAGSGITQESRSPIDRSVLIGKFASASQADVDAAVAAAKRAQKTWAALPWQERVSIMRGIAERIRERRYELAAVMSMEIGKTRFESLGDAEESADLIDYYADQVVEANGFERPLGQLAANESTKDVLRPYGVFAVIAPFNFPMALATGMCSGALLGGNAVVFKPAEGALMTAAMMAQIFTESRLPHGTYNIVYGSGRTIGSYLTRHEGIDGIAFTGSHEVGMQLLREIGASGRHAKPVLGELGGKNATIVTASADLEMASEGIMRSAFGLQGQKCSACSRVYVDKRVAEPFLKLLVDKTKAIVIGDPTKRDVFVGPVINQKSVETYERAAALARRDGSMLIGGERLQHPPFDRGYFVSPAIAQLPLSHELFQEELFLPFLAVGIVDSFDQALAESNRSHLGLTGGLYSEDEREIERFFDEMEAGVLYVNRRTGATTGAWPGVQSFCGWKGSGMTGRGGCGPYYVGQFMREQSRTRMMKETS
ncbi:MAG TPA: aldehyde dehydrogenase family protein [Candidatus Baltobacteraceae bacterium]|jgi:1-pyrroline-5-carboxylate dehydrogenase|nr:aldehyde dehydrogenase family protein [Candidatus Baltobacteraceae bacterium]